MFFVSYGAHTEYIIRLQFEFYLLFRNCCYRTNLLLQFKSTKKPKGRERYRLNRWNIVLSSTIFSLYIYIIKAKYLVYSFFLEENNFLSLDQYRVTRNCKLSFLCLSDTPSTSAVITVIELRQL